MSTATGRRRIELKNARATLLQLPCQDLIELPGRPHVVYQLRDYSIQSSGLAKQARIDIGFLFKAFETGQIGPKRWAKLHGGNPRQSTIHEYLDWTVTAQEAEADDELDFGGFRVVALLSRFRPEYPAPGAYEVEVPKAHPALGAPMNPLPMLGVAGKPITAATIRSGPGFIEIPFVATHETKRGRGYGRYMVEAIEDMARACGIRWLLLCSTDDESVKNTWLHLGFSFTTEADLEHMNVHHSDLMHMVNTVQMHKAVGAPRRWRPVIIKHQHHKLRTYVPIDSSLQDNRTYSHYVVANSDDGESCGYTQNGHGNGKAKSKGGKIGKARK